VKGIKDIKQRNIVAMSSVSLDISVVVVVVVVVVVFSGGGGVVVVVVVVVVVALVGEVVVMMMVVVMVATVLVMVVEVMAAMEWKMVVAIFDHGNQKTKCANPASMPWSDHEVIATFRTLILRPHALLRIVSRVDQAQGDACLHAKQSTFRDANCCDI